MRQLLVSSGSLPNGVINPRADEGIAACHAADADTVGHVSIVGERLLAGAALRYYASDATLRVTSEFIMVARCRAKALSSSGLVSKSAAISVVGMSVAGPTHHREA